VRRALISDIHGNLEALSAVLADIQRRGIDEIYFLGDVVGYGPNPEECTDLTMKNCKLHLLGNHDDALLRKAVGFNPLAKSAIDCTRERMKPDQSSQPQERARWEYLESLQRIHAEAGLTFVHASPRDYIFEYILPSSAHFEREKLKDVFTRFERVCFVGHSHLPGVMTEEPRFYTPRELSGEYRFPDPPQKVVVNIGSVGQPRDRDPRACYLELDDTACRWNRVEYDVQKTVEKVRSSSCLDVRNGLRLIEGR
jgi:diadenosine tetraphosphatase ApaH/serine/threonine PP2A family protein phosphatase